MSRNSPQPVAAVATGSDVVDVDVGAVVVLVVVDRAGMSVFDSQSSYTAEIEAMRSTSTTVSST